MTFQRPARLAVVIALALLRQTAWGQEPPRRFELPPPAESIKGKETPKKMVGETGPEQSNGGVIQGGSVAGAYGGYANAEFGGYPYNRAWHAGYRQHVWGQPVPLVVPPTVQYQTIWGWGVSSTQMAPVYPQYAGPANGTQLGGNGPYQTTPYWPWDTRQFGVYYIRAPW